MKLKFFYPFSVGLLHCALLFSTQLSAFEIQAKNHEQEMVLSSIDHKSLRTSDIMDIIESGDSKTFEIILNQFSNKERFEGHLLDLFTKPVIAKEYDKRNYSRHNRQKNYSAKNEKWSLRAWMIEKDYYEFFERTVSSWPQSHSYFSSHIEVSRDEWDAKIQKYILREYSLYEWLGHKPSHPSSEMQEKLAASDFKTNLNKVSLDDSMTAITCMTEEEAVITSARYTNEDVIWGRPKSLLMGNLPGAGPTQKPNLYPDRSSTYFVANVRLPLGAKLMLKGQYPHSRYISFTIANALGNGQYGNGNFLRGDQINPDEGSLNPFLATNTRDVEPRNFTLYVVHGVKPQNPEPNTLYTGTYASEHQRIHLSMRTYLADQGYDGTGNVELHAKEGNGLPVVTLLLPNGEMITGPQLVEILDARKLGDPNGYELDQWLALVANSTNPEFAPVPFEPISQVFWNTNYTVTGAFILDPEKRVREYPASDAGGFASNPDTRYQTMPFYLQQDKVLVIRGKMPTHPTTRRGEKTLPVDPQVQYFSVSTAAAPPYGAGWDTLVDEQIPVDKDGYYTIVVSWPWYRPRNAVPENGIGWITPGGGEGHFLGSRIWLGVVYIRYMNSSPNWQESPMNIPLPTVEEPIPQDERIMGPYYPRGKYMSTAEFEANY